MAQKEILCSLVLLIFIINLVPTSGLLNANMDTVDQAVGNENNDFQANDVETEIKPIENLITDNYKTSYFQPSPISGNNKTAVFKSVISEPDELVVNIDLEKSIVNPGFALNYVIQATSRVEPVQTDLIVDIIEGEYWGWYIYFDDNYYSNYNDRVIESHQIRTNSEGIWASSFNAEENGRYSIVVRSVDENLNVLESRSFTVAKVGIFWRLPYEYVVGEPYYSVAYVLNTSDFSPIPNAEVVLSSIIYHYNEISHEYTQNTQEVYSGVTDGNGSIELEFVMEEQFANQYSLMLNLSVTYDGETTYVSRDIYRGRYYWSWDGYSEFQPYEFIITTDKPIYLPGEVVKARILVWKNDYFKVTKEPIETEIKVELLSPSNYVFVNKIARTDEYGVSAMTFQLDTETELGYYQIVVRKGDSIGSLKIRVDKYEKPVFRVSINVEKEYVPPGKDLRGNVTAEYYFGKPVTHASVTLRIGDFDTITGQTNEEGYWEFKYRVPDTEQLEEIYSIPLNVSVEDNVGRIVEASTSFSVSDRIFVWAYVNPWNPRVDENITIYFGAYQYQGSVFWWGGWKPLKGASAKLTLYGVISETENVSTLVLNSFTDENGRGQAKFVLPLELAQKYTRFFVLVEVEENNGREGSTLVYFTVRRNIVETSLDSENYAREDNIKLTMAVKNSITGEMVSGGVKIRIYDADYDLIGERVEYVSVKGATITFKLSSYAPTGIYRIYVYLNTTFDYRWGSWFYYRYFTTVTFDVGTAHNIQLTSDYDKYVLGDSIKVTGQMSGNTNAPIMIQFVKKGIVKNIFISTTSSGTFTIEINDLGVLAPRFTIAAFAILTNGVVLETYLSLEIDASVTVTIESDKAIYEPGEVAKISISTYNSAGAPISTVLAVSFVDSSVYGVEPDPESEKYFFEESSYWPAVWTVSSWKNVQRVWWFLWYEDYYALGLSPRFGYYETQYYTDASRVGSPQEVGNVKGEQSSPADTNNKIRDNLPENAYWKPVIFLKDGKWETDIVLPDNIGEWTVRVVATTTTGQGSLIKYKFKTFLPFFVEIQKEAFVLQDDIFVVKGIVYNYLDELLEIAVNIETDDGLFVLGRTNQELRLPGDFLGSIGWTCLAKEAGFQNITISASTTLSNGTKFYDALRKSLEIMPNGISKTFKETGFVSQDPLFSYVKYDETISSKEFIQLTLGFGSVAISSWERLVGYPYGCIEQTMSRLIPDALILQYLREKGLLTTGIESELDNMITSGLSRVYSQRHNDGGWGWWSNDPSRVYMTSLVLYGLGVVNNTGYYVDPTVIESALDFIESRQKSDGSWNIDSWRSIDQVSFTAYTLRSILFWEDFSDISYTIQQGLNYIKNSWDDVDCRSTYLAALYLSSVPQTNYSDSIFQDSLYSYLLDHVKISEEGYYWTYATEQHYWWRALGGDIEVTSLALQGLAEIDKAGSAHVIRGAVEWLLGQQDYYGWGNTADTAAAISSIIYISSSDFSSDNDTTVTLRINSQEVLDINLTTHDNPSFYLKLDDYLLPGNNTIEFIKIGSGNVSYYFQGVQVLRKLPVVQIQEEITITANSEFSIPVTLVSQSENVFAYNVEVTPLEGAISPISMVTRKIDFLTGTEILDFNYRAPSEVGYYNVSGFEISYNLSDSERNIFSPAKITRRYGPISLHVVENSGLGFIRDTTNSRPEKEANIVQYNIRSSSKDFSVVRTYSKTQNLIRGELIFVELTITNLKGTENFLMLEDFVPTGFEVDTSTVEQLHGSYRLTSSGISFFFPELTSDTVTIRYGIIVNDVRQSSVRPARLSNMYDKWEVLSSSNTLGNMRLSIDVGTGAIIRDTELPSMDKFTIEESVSEKMAVANIIVEASDNWGVASVKIYIKQNTWRSFECSLDDGQWSVTILSLTEGQSEIYVEVVDEMGNIFVSDISVRYLELQDLYIPFVQVLILFTMSLSIALFATLIIKKRVS
ncbi:MAG: MG2 domain-containing protein [Candidatus Hodarchaeales archaeon]